MGYSLSYKDFYRHLAQGKLSGVFSINEFGRNQDVGESRETLMNGSGLYHWIEIPTYLNASSSSSNDTIDGSGAQKIEIHGLDEDYVILNEQVELNGTSTVTTTNKFFRVNDFQVVQAGSGGVNDGEISLVDANTSDEINNIPSGESKSHAAVYTIPYDYTGILVGWHGAERSKQGVTLELWRNGKYDVFYIDRETVLNGTEFERNFVVPIGMPAKVDIEIRVTAAQAGAYVTGGFVGYIIHDDKLQYY